MHDEPAWNWRTELTLFAFCVGLTALWVVGCWIGYRLGDTVNGAIRWLAHLV